VTKYRHAENYKNLGDRGDTVRGRKTSKECVKVDIKRLGLVKDDAHN